MTYYSKQIEVRWSDLDPNFHLRHSVYYDFEAFMRTCFLVEIGLTPKVFMQQQFGPIVFREECVFKKEIQFGDKIMVNASLLKARADYSRRTIIHKISKMMIPSLPSSPSTAPGWISQKENYTNHNSS